MDELGEALVNEIHVLRKAHDRWRAIAIGALVLVFVALIPVTVFFWRLVQIRESRDMMMREQVNYLHEMNYQLEKRLKEKEKSRSSGPTQTDR